MGYTHYKRSNSSLALAVLLIALSLMTNHRIHVVARHLMETSLPDDLPEVPEPEVPEDPEEPDDPMNENPVPVVLENHVPVAPETPVPVAPENPLYPQPDFPEAPGDIPELPPYPELPSPSFTTISAQRAATRP